VDCRWQRLGPNIATEEMSMFNNLSGDREYVTSLTTENNKEQKKKEGVSNDDDMLQPVNKVNSKLDKESQDWEVESTHSAD
jgi:hypothetical protein